MKPTHIAGFDYLRAVMSIFVVAWHMQVLGVSLMFSEDRYLEHTFSLTDLVYFHILLLAVPTFILMSTFLYALRGADAGRLRKQSKRILILLTFWPVALILYNNGYAGVAHLLPDSPSMLAVTLLRAGNTIYWFFVSLLISLLVTHWIAKLGNRLQWIGFGLAVCLVVLLPQLTKTMGYYGLSAFWNPLNFVPLAFAAVLLANHVDSVRSNPAPLMVGSIVLCVAFALLEWNFMVDDAFFPGQGYAIPAYTRASSLFAVIGLIVLALDERVQTPPVIGTMAKYALALYCIHPFLITPVRGLVALLMANSIYQTSVSIVLVVALSYAFASLLRTYYLKDELLI